MQLEKLNKYQKDAVLNTEGPMRVIAGPGSGKTRTIIAKVNHILKEEFAHPNQILILTFTNKAVNEVKKRLLEHNEKLKHVFTFHSFASYFLRVEAKRLGIERDYIILDRNDQNQILKKEIKNLSEENTFYQTIDMKEVFEKFSYFNNDSEIKSELNLESKYDKLIFTLYERYKVYKNKINGYDFDDLLINLEKILRENGEIREIWEEKFKYIFIDEFQDVNKNQYSIIRSLTNRNSNITVVGDPDQNIYSWRGSEIAFILNFNNDFENVKTVILKINYRSTVNIINISNKLISHNKDRVDFEVDSIKNVGEPIRVVRSHSKFEQAENIVSEIIRLNKEKYIKLKEIAIIYRANYLSSEFEHVLARRGINYRLIGGLKFYDREEIKRMLYFLRFALFQDDHSFINIINFPPRKFGDKSLERLEKLSQQTGKSYWNEIKENKQELKLKSIVLDFIDNTDKYINEFNKLESGTLFSSSFREYIRSIGIFSFYENNPSKIENLDGLFSQLNDTFSLSTDLRNDLIQFLNQTTLLTGGDNEEIENHVTLITAHAAKGTEYEIVFLVSFNEEVFPTYQSISEGSIEEERRVAYVAITRAKELLYISYVVGVDFNKKIMAPSRFLYDMDLVSKRYKIKKPFNEGRYTLSSNFKRDNNFEEEESNDDFSSELTKNNYSVRPESVVMHKKYGDGVVISAESDVITVAFDKKTGIKKILKDHASWYLKDK